MKTAIYLRVSTKEQALTGYGLDYQLAKCEAQASLKEWEVYKVYQDKGVSGTAKKIKERLALKAMLKDIENGLIDCVIVYALDRLGRSTKLVLDIVDKITDNNVELLSHKESLDTSTPTGRFVLRMFASLAELERDSIVERTTNGLHQRGKVDGEMGGRLPYGYNRRESGTLTINKKAVPIIRRVFNMRDNKATYQAIADSLTSEGVITPYGKQVWGKSSIRTIINNRNKYLGGYRGKSTKKWPKIL